MIKINIFTEHESEREIIEKWVASLNDNWVKLSSYSHNIGRLANGATHQYGCVIETEAKNLQGFDIGIQSASPIKNQQAESMLIAEVGMLKASGKSFGAIAAILNADGVTTPNGTPFYRQTVKRLFGKYQKEQLLLTKK